MQRLPFEIVACSSYEDQFEPTNLIASHHQRSFNKGWESNRFCRYPQVLVLKLPTNCRVKKVQLLVHHYKIPCRTEIHIAQTKKVGFNPSVGQLMLDDEDSDVDLNGFDLRATSTHMQQRQTGQHMKKFSFSRLGWDCLQMYHLRSYLICNEGLTCRWPHLVMSFSMIMPSWDIELES